MQLPPEDPFTPLTHEQLNELRLRIVRGEEPTIEEMQAVVQTLQAARPEKTKAAPKSRAKVKIPSLDDLL